MSEGLPEVFQSDKSMFGLFVAEFKRWVEYWGLKDWELFFEHKPLDECRAEVLMGYTGRVATVSFALYWGYEPSEEEVCRVAFHEARELFYGMLTCLAKERFTTPPQIEEETHACIRRDENTIFREYWMRREKGKKKPKAKAKPVAPKKAGKKKCK